MDWVSMIDRSPGWVRRPVLALAQGRTAAGVALDRIRHRDVGDTGPSLPEPSLAAMRVLIGPANEAEQGYQWARALRNLPGVDAVSLMGFDPGGYGVASDVTVHEDVYLRSPEWHRRLDTWMRQRTHIVWESGLPILGRRDGADAYAEIERFRADGVRTAVMFHGSDIRSPRRHMSEHVHSPFTDPAVPSRILEDRARRNARRVTELGLTAFVSTPDLLRHLPGAVWCPTVVDPSRWRAAADRRVGAGTDAAPLVVHAPSNPRIKGTLAVEPTLRRLESEGVIRYRRLEGVPHAAVPEAYAQADIVLDQFLIGCYGVAAIEALAAGRLVIGHVDPPTRELVREETGFDVPIIEADPDSLERVLRDTVADLPAAEELRRAGPTFVDAVHDGTLSAVRLRSALSG